MDKPIIKAKADSINKFKQWLISEEREVRTVLSGKSVIKINGRNHDAFRR